MKREINISGIWCNKHLWEMQIDNNIRLSAKSRKCKRQESNSLICCFISDTFATLMTHNNCHFALFFLLLQFTFHKCTTYVVIYLEYVILLKLDFVSNHLIFQCRPHHTVIFTAHLLCARFFCHLDRCAKNELFFFSSKCKTHICVKWHERDREWVRDFVVVFIVVEN